MTTTEARPLKDRILQAALDELRELDPEALLHAIGARAIARRAGANSPGSINHHFGSLGGLADAVVERVFDTRNLNVPKINELVEHIRDSTLPLGVAFAMHAAEFERLTTDEEFKLRMGLWGLGGPTVNERYGAMLRETEADIVDAANTLFRGWGRELRPPLDMTTYLALKVSLLNGTTTRHLADPDDRRMYVFQRASVALDLVLLRALGDRHDVDSRLSEMNYYPLQKRSDRTNNRSRATVARILRSANELFNQEGFADTGIDQIATRADVSLTTLKRYFPSKQDLAVALLCEQFRSHREAVTVGPSVVAHLEDLVEFARARVTQSSAYLARLATALHDESDPIVEATQASLANDPDRGADTDAANLVVLTLRHALVHPTHTAYDIASSLVGDGGGVSPVDR